MRISVFEKIGQKVAVATLAAALTTIGANFQTAKLPLTYSHAGKAHKSSKVAVVRTDTGEEVGVMGPDYKAMNNEQALEVLDYIAKETGATYERGGENKGKYFVSLRLPFSVAPKRRPDDRTDLFFTGFNSFNGSCPIALAENSIRIVCQNTFAASLFSAFARIRHSEQAEARLAAVKASIAFAIAERDSLQAKVDKLEGMTFTAAEMQAFARKLFPVPTGDLSERNANRIGQLVQLFSNEPTGNLGRSRYDALNAVTEYADFFAPSRATEGSTAEANRFESVFFGQSSDLKRRAADMLLAV